MHDVLKNRCEKAIEDRVFPGCVIGVASRGREPQYLALGGYTYDTRSPRVQENTIYDLASITKSIPTASLVSIFVEANAISLDAAVKEYIPEIQNDYSATVEDLLRYRVRGARMSTIQSRTFEQVRAYVLENGFDGPAGEYSYSNAPAFLLGMIVERVSGSILPALAQKHFFGPLGMEDTTFFPHDIARVAPTEIVQGEEIRGIVHDESARIFSRVRRSVGHAGVFSTAPDLIKFLHAVLDSTASYGSIARDAEEGLGWQVAEEYFMGSRHSAKTFGKTGFTGTSVCIDRSRGVALVILSNRTYPQRPPDATSQDCTINVFRRDVSEIVFSAL